MMINRHAKIYIMCPAHVATGGTELLHQLGAQLISLGFEARMFYYAQEGNDPVSDQFREYQVPYAESIEDVPDNVMVFAETSLSGYYAVRHLQRVIWWLSVDHYLMNMGDSITKFLQNPLGAQLPQFYMFGDDSCSLHLFQSEYARQFLEVNQVPASRTAYLGDYLNRAFLQNAEIYRDVEKRDLVLYNPKKGSEFTGKLIAAAPDLHWIPIQNLTPRQVSLLMGGAKVYIDFGYHPGKDRIPREAAVCGCCVLTGKRGAAANDIDVPIPEDYKFADEEAQIPAILQRIREVFADYDIHQARFAPYRERILKEQEVFVRNVQEIFAVS